MVRLHTEHHSNGSLVSAKVMPNLSLQQTCASFAGWAAEFKRWITPMRLAFVRLLAAFALLFLCGLGIRYFENDSGCELSGQLCARVLVSRLRCLVAQSCLLVA